MRPSFTKHVDRRTLPAWVTEGYRRNFERDESSDICNTPVYENGNGLAFGAKLEAGKIGCINWMYRVDKQSCQEVLREAKARRATGLYLPGKGHVPEFPVGDNDAIIEIPVSKTRSYKIRFVIFDVYNPDFFYDYKTDISFTPECSEVYADQEDWGEFCLGSGGYLEGEVDIESWMHVSESARGINLTLSCPLLLFRLYGDDDYHLLKMAIRPDFDHMYDQDHIDKVDQTDEDEFRRIYRVFDADVSWRKKFLRVDEFDCPRNSRLLIYDVEETEDDDGFVIMDYKLLVVRGFYLPRAFQPEFWPGETEASYRSLFNSFSEVLAAGVIQRAWRRVACNPNHRIGNRILRKEAERFFV